MSPTTIASPASSYTHAHWLDSEVLRLVTISPFLGQVEPQAFDSWYPWKWMLKLWALFGENVALSDVQLTDSPVIMSLFRDPDFRGFLDSHPEFMKLVAKPKAGTERIHIARAGLERFANNPAAMSSYFETAVPTQKIAEILLKADVIDVDRELAPGKNTCAAVRKQFPHHAEQLEGLIRGVWHFAHHPGALAQSPPANTQMTNYFEELARMASGPGASRIARDTHRFIVENVDEPKRPFRTAVLDVLKRTKMTPYRAKQMWFAVVDAWNNAVGETVNAPHVSVTRMSRTPSVVVPAGHATDIQLPIRVLERSHRRQPTIPVFSVPFDPALLTWEEVGRLVNATHRTRNKLIQARATGTPDELCDLRASHAKELAKQKIEYRHPSLKTEALWLVSEISLFEALQGDARHASTVVFMLGTGARIGVEQLRVAYQRYQLAGALQQSVNMIPIGNRS
jgi:hypothetical protein